MPKTTAKMIVTTRAPWLLAATLATLVMGGLPLQAQDAQSASLAAAPAPERDASRDLVVHEWGTFTNFSGSDGIQLDFRPLVDADLPDFVWNLDSMSPSFKIRLVSRQRMETPVIYFYTSEPREVNVRVDFPTGLLTEFYPPAVKVGPNQRLGMKAPIGNGWLDWQNVRLVPPAMADTITVETSEGPIVQRVPGVEGYNHYVHARGTGSALVVARDPFGGQHVEQFLFYRGVGNFHLPLEMVAIDRSHFRITNHGADRVGTLFLIQIDQHGMRFHRAKGLDPAGEDHLQLPGHTTSLQVVSDQLAAALVQAGLYEPEARAMIETWQSSWFGEPGTRLLYLVPSRLTDEILPLHLEPQPKELVRVLVGRMEILTPDTEQQLLRTIQDLGTCASLSDPVLKSELAPLGRFAEPALSRLTRLVHEPEPKAMIENMLGELEEQVVGSR